MYVDLSRYENTSLTLGFQGYARSARLFLLQEKYDIALEMIRLALDRVKPEDVGHRSELEGMQQAISDARDARTALEAQSRPHVVKLPVELISEVFILATEMDIAVPICVSLVCSHWRSIALSMPALWRRIAISNVLPVRKMELWLERSKNRIAGLRIREDISRLQLQESLANCGPDFFKALKSVHCEVDVLLLSSHLMNVPNILDLDLDDIQVSVSRRSQVDSMTASLGPLVPLTRTSSARSLVVEYITVDWSIVVPRLSHLRNLIIRTSFKLPTTTLLCTLFKSNPHLEQVILESGSPSDLAEVVKDDRIALPRLTYLELLGPMDVTGLVSRLSLPVLERLAFSQSLSAADQALLALEPPSPALTELSVRKCSFAEQRLASFLRRIQTLTKLEITHSGSPMDPVVDAVAGSRQVDGQTRLVCPLLRYVDFSHCSNLNGGPIVRLVKPRLVDPTDATTSTAPPMPPPVRIQSIHINGCPRVDPVVPEWLRSRVDKVSCVYMTKSDLRKIRR
jgi:F-box/TPR repeat protein Pof3